MGMNFANGLKGFDAGPPDLADDLCSLTLRTGPLASFFVTSLHQSVMYAASNP